MKRGAVAPLQESKGADERFGVEGWSSAFWGEWMELAKALDKAQEGVDGQGGVSQGLGYLTPLIFRTPSLGVDL